MVHPWAVEHAPAGTPIWKRIEEIEPESDYLWTHLRLGYPPSSNAEHSAC